MKLKYRKGFYKYIFVILAMFIAIGSLIVSNMLVTDLAKEERSKIKIWAEATKNLLDNSSSDNENDVGLILQIIESNKTIPVIMHIKDRKEERYDYANINIPEVGSQEFLRRKASKFEKKHLPIIIEVADFQLAVYYDDSYTLKQLQLYPYVQLAVMFIFVIICMLAIFTSMKAEQDKLWVGLTKETAHQLGTPISSLMAWIEYLRIKDTDESILANMEKDIARLQMITDRFSKVGSTPAMEKRNVAKLIRESVNYLEPRISKKVQFFFNFPQKHLYANINESLFNWVIENLTKNAVDAMSGQGEITYTVTENKQMIYIDIDDTGKGIAKSKFKDIFSPGYTTKTRGWGLGLSLAKRIIEQYHKGKIYVHSSEQNLGTTFRIELKKAD